MMLLFSTSGAMCDEMVSGLVRCDVSSWHVSNSLDISRTIRGWFNKPLMQVQSPTAIVEYSYENILRSKRDGVLTADSSTSTDTTSVILPFTLRDNDTKMGMSQRHSRTSIFLNDSPETRSNLQWTDQTDSWGISDEIGIFTLGVTGFKKNGSLSGDSAYPQQIFHILNTDTDIAFDYRNIEREVDISANPTPRILVRLGVGRLDMSNNLNLSNDETRISLPMKMRLHNQELTVISKFTRNLSFSLDTSLTNGSTVDHIYLASQDSGKLKYNVGGKEHGLSVCYAPDIKRVIYGGWASKRHSLNLIGAGIQGQQLGIAIKPWNEKIDFDAKAITTVNTYYVGYERLLSQKWSLSTLYRFSHLRQDVNADYVGRTFFGMVSAYGSYFDELPDYALHGLELSTTFTQNRFSVVLGLEQVVPQIICTHASNPPTSEETNKPKVKTRSTGGTCLTVRCAYSL